MNMTYKVLNKISVLNMPEDEYCGNGIERHAEESDEILSSYGYDDKESYIIRTNDGAIEWNCVYDAIQAMSIKDGVDIVQFNDGKIGYVAYNGTYEDYFEILGKAESVKDLIDMTWDYIGKITLEDEDGNEIIEANKGQIEEGKMEEYENMSICEFWTYDENPYSVHITITVR